MPLENTLLFGVGAALALFIFFLAPALGLPAPLVIAMAAVFAPLQWSLIHESIHGHLARNPTVNRRLGRLLCWTLGFSWDVVRFGHLMHHRLNRHEFDRPEQLKPGMSWPRAATAYYFKLLGGHAVVSALAAPVMCAMPGLALRLAPVAGPDAARLKAAARHYFFKPQRRRRIQADAAIGLLLIGLALLAWRAHPLVFALAFTARWVVLSLLDNMPHYGSALDGGFDGHNMKAPRALRWLLLNQNFHGLHHRRPHLPWFELAAHFESSGEGYSAGWLTALLAQLRGPVALAPTALRAEAAE